MNKRINLTQLRSTFDLANARLLGHIAHKKGRRAFKAVALIGATVPLMLSLALGSAFSMQGFAANARDHMDLIVKLDHMDPAKSDHM